MLKWKALCVNIGSENFHYVTSINHISNLYASVYKNGSYWTGKVMLDSTILFNKSLFESQQQAKLAVEEYIEHFVNDSIFKLMLVKKSMVGDVND